MNRRLHVIAISIAVLLATPSMAKCGEDGVLGTVTKMVRESYFEHDDEPRKLELASIRIAALDKDIGLYKCSASLEFEAHIGDLAARKGIMDMGPASIPFQYEVSPDAREPENNIITLLKIRALEIDWDNLP